MDTSRITLDHGSGGLAGQELIAELFLKHLKSQDPGRLEDCALLAGVSGKIAFSTDSYVVDPLFFPGGDIGRLAVHGTINDLAMRGARPLALSLGLILEEGLETAVLERVLAAIGEAAEAAGVPVVTGDTKVLPRGKADKIFINTAGIGEVAADVDISGAKARPGDAVLLSGTLADHGITIMAAQAGLSLEGDLKSDTQALHRLIAAMLAEAGAAVHVLRDPTRGGLATTLWEIARSSGVGIELEEEALPVRPETAAACAMIGLDPLYLANEGKCIVICASEAAERLLAVMRAMPEGADAARIGSVRAAEPGRVVLRTLIGGLRLLEPLTGQPLPRIC